MKLRNFELEDQPWFPKIIKESMTDYLRFVFYTFNLYQPVVPLLKRAIDMSSDEQIVDLCSGSGGAVENIWECFKKKYHKSTKFILTDIYPRIQAYKYLSEKSGNEITYVEYPVDATNVPLKLHGFRTMFSGIHHFAPNEVKTIIRDTARAQEGLAIFDGGNRSLAMILLILVFHPIAILLGTPFVKPFNWWRLFFTYIIPLVPIGAIWDGIISIINLYEPSKLLAMAKESDTQNYFWEAGKVRTKFGLSVSYLLGIPGYNYNESTTA